VSFPTINSRTLCLSLSLPLSLSLCLSLCLSLSLSLSLPLSLSLSLSLSRILRVDPECREKPLRTKDGLCVIADYGEVGLLTSEIDQKNVNTRFDGYSDSKSTEKKLLRNVLMTGDTYFNTGDLIYRDADGYFYWSDRVGDTFRWKGENVATTEVENCLSTIKEISEVTVYGVTVPNCDGRVGMASLILHEAAAAGATGGTTGDWKQAFHEECVKNLPSYARPAFIRIQTSIQVTGTFKHQKSVLVEDGFDPSKMGKDLLFLYQQKDGQMIPLTQEIYGKILKGEIKF
jgi:acyl-CoA synthetase (AMP-forming)/AMP-acid ligase II